MCIKKRYLRRSITLSGESGLGGGGEARGREDDGRLWGSRRGPGEGEGRADRCNHTGEQGHAQGTEKTTWESDRSESRREGRPPILKLKGTGAFIRSK